MIEASTIGMDYGAKTVLHELDFSLSSGDIVALIGPNGCGKTTLLRILALIQKPSHGQITVDEQEAFANLQSCRRKLGYVPQEVTLFQELSAEENLYCWSSLPKRATAEKTAELATELGFDTYLRKPVHKLSGGMKRKINLAVAMISEPPWLILDEPFSGMDPENGALVATALQKRAAQGAGIIVSLHENYLLDYCTKILALRNGRVEYYGATKGDKA